MRVRLRITGRVQGVFFRESMRKEADRLGVRGWVRNTPDGAVEAVVEGAPDAVRALVAWSRRGPPSAHVAAVQQEEEAAGEPFPGFEVRR